MDTDTILNDNNYKAITQHITELLTSIGSLENHAELAEIAFKCKTAVDDFSKLITELNKVKLAASVKAARLIDEEQQSALMEGNNLPSNYYCNSCSYNIKYDVTYKVDNKEKFNWFLTLAPNVMLERKMLAPHFPNICKFLDEYGIVDIRDKAGILIERFPTITMRKRAREEGDSNGD